MNSLMKKLLSGGLAVCLMLSPIVATAAPQQQGGAEVTSILAVSGPETEALATINNASEAEMGAAITDNATVLGLRLTDYNLLTNNSPVHKALVGKKFRTKSSVKSAFDRAVATEKKAEAVAIETAAVLAVNSADATEMEAVITANAQALGLNLTAYNLLLDKSSVHKALVEKKFRTKSSVKSAFDRAVATEKKAEAVAAEAAAIIAVNNADAAGMGAVITTNAQALGLNLTKYNLLTDKSSVDKALVGKKFRTRSLIKSAFDRAVAAEKRVEDAAKKKAIYKIDRITKGASATGITKQDLIDAGVKVVDVIDTNLTAYQAAISAAANYALNSTAEIQKMVEDVNKANANTTAKQRLTTAVNDAKALIGSKTVGTAVGNVSQATHDAFQAAINAATAVMNNANATLDQMNEQITALGSATTAFNNALITETETIYSVPGTYGPTTGLETVAGNAKITVSGVTLKNLKINGDLEIAASVGDEGDVYLNNVTVIGQTIVRGGGENSFHITNSNLTGRLVVIKEGGKVRIVAEGSTSIPNVQLQSGATLQNLTETGSGFGQVTVEAFVGMGDAIGLEGDFTDVTVEVPGVTVTVPNGRIDNLTLSAGATGSSVNVSGGTVSAMTVAQGVTGTSVTMSSGGIGLLNINEKAQVQVQGGTVSTVTVASTAANTTMNVQAGATVTTMSLNSGTSVTSSGNIGQLNVGATSQVQVQGGTVGAVTVESTAGNTTMNVGAGATVTTMTLNSGISVTGTGSIGTAEINANGVSFEHLPPTVKVDPSVTVPPKETPKVIDPPPPSESGTIEVTFPNGTVVSVPKGVIVNGTEAEVSEIPTKSGIATAGAVMKFTTNLTGEQKDAGVLLKMKATDQNAVLCYYDDLITQKWQIQEGSIQTVSPGNYIVSAIVHHFSMYGPIIESAQLIADGITTTKSLADGDTELPLSAIRGYDVSIESSTNPKVIDLNGKVTQQPSQSTIDITYKICKGSSDIVYTHQSVVVPALAATAAPEITDVTSILGAALTADKLTFSLSKLTKTSGIEVSKRSTLKIKMDKVEGDIGDFSLLAGDAYQNNILNTPLPTNLVLSDLNFTTIFEAIKDSDSTTKNQVIDAVDFTALFNLIQQTDPSITDKVLADIDFVNLFSAIRSTTPEMRNKIMTNMTTILDLAANNVKDSDKSNFKDDLGYALSGIGGDLDKTQYDLLKRSIGASNLNLTQLFKDLELRDDQIAPILSHIKYPELFKAVRDYVSSTTRTEIFTTINFTDLFNAARNADTSIKGIVYNDVIEAVDTIATKSTISRVAILNTIAFGDIDRGGLFNVLNKLDASSTDLVVVMTATLTDTQGHSKVYTINIHK